jgi:glycerol kinase
VIRPVVAGTSSLGAAYAAGLAVGVWDGLDTLRAHWQRDAEWTPRMDAGTREREHRRWRKAVQRSLGWLDDEPAAGGAAATDAATANGAPGQPR